MGTTGSSLHGSVNTDLPDLVNRVHQYTDTPVAVGFGIATRDHFEAVWKAGSDGVVVASRLISIIKGSERSEMLNNVKKYCLELSLKDQGSARIPPRQSLNRENETDRSPSMSKIANTG